MILLILFLTTVQGFDTEKYFGLVLQGLERDVLEEASSREIEVFIDLDQGNLSRDLSGPLITGLSKKFTKLSNRKHLTKDADDRKKAIISKAKQISKCLTSMKRQWFTLLDATIDPSSDYVAANTTCAVESPEFPLYEILTGMDQSIDGNIADVERIENMLGGEDTEAAKVTDTEIESARSATEWVTDIARGRVTEATESVKQKVRTVEEIQNSQVPPEVLVALDKSKCLSRGSMETTRILAFSKHKEGLSVLVEVNQITNEREKAYDAIPVPFMVEGKRYTLDFTDYLSKNGFRILNPKACTAEGEILKCQPNSWRTDACLHGLISSHKRDIQRFCKFVPSTRTERAIQTKQGLLVLPQAEGEVSIVSVGKTRVERLPALIEGPGEVVIRAGRDEEVYHLTGEGQKIRYLAFNITDLKYFVNGPELTDFIPEILSENAEEITTLVTLGVQLGSIPLILCACYRAYQFHWCQRRGRPRDDDVERGEEMEMMPPAQSSRSNRERRSHMSQALED